MRRQCQAGKLYQSIGKGQQYQCGSNIKAAVDHCNAEGSCHFSQKSKGMNSIRSIKDSKE